MSAARDIQGESEAINFHDDHLKNFFAKCLAFFSIFKQSKKFLIYFILYNGTVVLYPTDVFASANSNCSFLSGYFK